MSKSKQWYNLMIILNNIIIYTSSETDLRKALVRSKLAECQVNSNLLRSDSMDSMLGDSLLDPPQSLQKIPPKRYQSPSRCGSPSLETPEHLLFGVKKHNVSIG